MRFVTYFNNSERRAGALLEDRVVDLQRAQVYLFGMGDSRDVKVTLQDRIPNSMIEIIQHDAPYLQTAGLTVELIQKALPDAEKELTEAGILSRCDQITFAAPLTDPGKIICAGMNYPSLGSSKDPSPGYPVLFLKPGSTLTGHRQPIQLPRVSELVLCEGELAVVIGKKGKHIPREAAHHYVAGYTIANDVGAQDLEKRTSQWTTGKLPDTFCPMGPAIVTPEQVEDVNNLAIETHINGNLVQSGNTGEMIFDIPYLISYISAITTLLPGDILLTGSPKRLNHQPAPPVYLRPGDEISIEIEGIGTLSNFTVSEGIRDA